MKEDEKNQPPKLDVGKYQTKKGNGTGTKHRKRRAIIWGAVAVLLLAAGGFLDSHIYNPVPAILCFLLGLVSAASGLRIDLINNGSKHRTANVVWFCIVLPSIALCGWLFYPVGSNQVETLKKSRTNVPLVVENNTIGWLPPELPPGCSNVSVSFGTMRRDVPIWLAKIQHDESKALNESNADFEEAGVSSNTSVRLYGGLSATNEIGTNEIGTELLINDLQSNLISYLENSPGYSPRKRHVGPSAQPPKDFPVWPLVISNRLFVEVEIPFINEWHRVLMSRDFESKLSKLPRLWDINYNSNKFEVVNEDKNPVLQVIYKSPREVQVNGIYVVDKFNIFGAFNTFPFWGQPITEMAGDQSMQQMDTNFVYRVKCPNQKTIFKYPSWEYFGKLSD